MRVCLVEMAEGAYFSQIRNCLIYFSRAKKKKNALFLSSLIISKTERINQSQAFVLTHPSNKE